MEAAAVNDFTALDIIAVFWFLLCWAGFAYFADHSRFSSRSMNHAMNSHRRRWMDEMLTRDNRVVDTQIIGNQLNGAAFFASTMILLVGGQAALGWFLHPLVFMVASLWVVFALYRREFRSKALRAVRG